jgi:tRNA-Thr(GGU) m(6)t(6)A37 methyltransferase TsaA
MKKRPARPPAAHRDRPPRDDDPDEMPAWTFRPIGVVRSPYRYVHDAPRQGGPGRGERAVVELRRGMQNCLKDLAGFERVWIVFVFSFARGWRQQVVPPRDVVKRGVFATRAPHRPNPIGITAARVVGVRGRTITIDEHDLLDGTPVLDVKPYVPYCDAHPGARAGWVDGVAGDASDHRWK